MRVNTERLARMKKDSDALRTSCVHPIWLARVTEMGALQRRRAAQDGLYQRTVVIFWKPFLRNRYLEIARILQFRERSPPALGNLGHILNAWP
jgi:hypothetical protein